MQQLLLILPAVLPVFFWAAYHYHHDRHLPEPAWTLVLAFTLGVLATGVAKLLYLGLDPIGLRYDAMALAESNRLGLFVYAMLVIGPLEEMAKLLPFVVVIIRLKAFNEPVDGIIYASFIGLGFAAAENFLYLDDLTWIEAVARGFASPVVHILFASVWAHWITSDWLARRPIGRSLLAGFLIAASLHGLYDFLVLLSPVSALPIAAVMIVALWVWRLIVLRRHQDAALTASNGPQPRL